MNRESVGWGIRHCETHFLLTHFLAGTSLNFSCQVNRESCLALRNSLCKAQCLGHSMHSIKMNYFICSSHSSCVILAETASGHQVSQVLLCVSQHPLQGGLGHVTCSSQWATSKDREEWVWVSKPFLVGEPY